MKFIQENLINNLKDSDIKFDVIRYKYVKMKSKQIRNILKIIFIFENFITNVI